VTAVEFEFTLPEMKAAIDRREHGRDLAEEAEILSGDLKAFIAGGWHVVEPKHQFLPNWHIDAICEHVTAAFSGEIKRLGIMVPPRTMKSLCVSVFAPAWHWLRDPGTQFLTASYGSDLSTGFAVQSRDLIRSKWYQDRWADRFQLKSDANLKTRYANNCGGQRLATSVGGVGTGEGGDILIIDDPHNADEILSDVKRQAAIEWHDGTISTRFNQPETGVEIIIMQRLHERDVMGHVLDLDGRDEWTILCLPEEYEPAHPYVTPRRVQLDSGRSLLGDVRSVPGELLFPERIGPDAHAQRKRRLGSYRAAGQLQQRPTAAEGAILKRAYWSYFDPSLLADENLKRLPRFLSIALSWDTAFKDKTTSDFVAGGLWGIAGADRYLLRVVNERLSLAETKARIKEHRSWALERWPDLPVVTVIEKSANGVEIIEQLKREIPGVKNWVAATDKTTRAWAAQPDLESGNVFLPGYPAPEGSGYDESRTPASTQELVEQAARFPFGEHDDMVDMVTQLVNWARVSAPQAASFAMADGRV